MTRPVISLLTDFGARDAFVGICKGVILGIVPDAQLVDLTHDVAPFHVRDAAVLLRGALPYLPVGVHLAVVDPGVGTERRSIALRVARGDTLVGPDNGLLIPAAEALGGIEAAHRLTETRYQLRTVSSTFHGRDVFAPAAGHLAAGVPLDAFGPAVDPADLVPLALPAAQVSPGELRAAVLYLDRFGNAALAATRADLERAFGPLGVADRLKVTLRADATTMARWLRSFGGVAMGEPLLYEDSSGLVALAVNQGSAAERFGLVADDEVVIRRG